MKRIAIIGASYLQNPLIQKAKSMGLETHVFAWQCGDVGETTADYFYPISIVEKDAILAKCKEIGIDGICTIASDLAVVTVNYVAQAMGLVGNTAECTYLSTNKHAMRRSFIAHGDPSPVSLRVTDMTDLSGILLRYPVIVKPSDRSGSRGITKLMNEKGLEKAIQKAVELSFEKAALVEEFATGQEYSVECISWEGNHTFLALTHKYTTGAPHFIETGHLEPAPVDAETLEKVKAVTFHALDSLQIRYGASHTELKIAKDGAISLIEIGSRMGGDFIGSSLVELSTGVDFVEAVIETALGQCPALKRKGPSATAAVRFVFNSQDLNVLAQLKSEHPEYLVMEAVEPLCNREVVDSGSRFGCYLMRAETKEALSPYLPRD